MSTPRPLPKLMRPPEARAESVEELVHLAQSGKIRVPEFQRGLKWESKQVLELFDSIYRGLPIGSLMVVRRHAAADTLHLGPLRIDAPASAEAWAVIDGQQRLTSLAASLARPLPLPTSDPDPFVVYFAAQTGSFATPPHEGASASTWVPLPLLLDATRLGEWILDQWPHRSDRELTRAVYEAGKRIREYRVPLYIIETDDPETLREIFFRVNNAGKRLTWNEVHDALYGHTGNAPATIAQLSDALTALGMGRIEPKMLTSCLVALRGLDVTRTLAEHRRKDRDILRGAVAQALPVLKQVLTLLKTRWAVPHLRLLPRSLVLEALSRFFSLHPEPNPRTLLLLGRWVWRTLLDERADPRILRRRAVAAIDPKDQEKSVQQLLALVSATPPPIVVPDHCDARSASSRLALLALASLKPRDLDAGQPVDVAALIGARNALPFRSVLTPARAGSRNASPGNRILLPGTGAAHARLLDRIRRGRPQDDIVLASHAISPTAAEALDAQQTDDFLTERMHTIQEVLATLSQRLAGWDRHDRDRPSLQYLLEHPPIAEAS